MPYLVELADGTECRFGQLLGSGMAGYVTRYGCDDNRFLVSKDGEAAVNVGPGGWTVQVGNSSSGSVAGTADVAKAVVLTRA